MRAPAARSQTAAGRNGSARRRVVTQQKIFSASAVCSAWLLRVTVRLPWGTVFVLLRSVSQGGAPGERPRTQVVAPQDESGEAETPVGVFDVGEKAAAAAADGEV